MIEGEKNFETEWPQGFGWQGQGARLRQCAYHSDHLLLSPVTVHLSCTQEEES